MRWTPWSGLTVPVILLIAATAAMAQSASNAPPETSLESLLITPALTTPATKTPILPAVVSLPEPELEAASKFRIERLPVAGGAELLTVIVRVPGEPAEVPMLSVLRDTLGDQDPENDRLRYVWVLSDTRPTLLNRAAGSLPFFYWRTDFSHPGDSEDPSKAGDPSRPARRPEPILDLGSASRPVWTSLAGSLTQVLALDPEGALVRSSTRSYRSNLEDRRRVHLLEGLALLSRLEDIPEVRTLLSEPELLEMQTRLTLAGQTLGGLVTAEKLPEAYMKQRTHSEELRGHNWELLRQKAESNGLYFEPLGFNQSATHALLWIASADLTERKWDGQFLGIADPYRDPRLRNWTGYREIRDGREMIPLALYALEYPKVPLLLVDFRDSHSAKRREMIRHAATDTISGVLGISKFGNWPYLVGSTTFNFVRVRHGATNDRGARLKAYSQVREWLALDDLLDPALRAELRRRLEIMGVNPMEESIFAEAATAQRQYAALIRYAQDPHGLPARIEHDREAELATYEHSAGELFKLRLAKVATLGLYSPRADDPQTVNSKLDEQRRVAKETRFLETVAKSGPETEVVWNMNEVRRALDELAASHIPARSAQAVERIMRQTNDEETRALCQRALQNLNAAGLE